MTCDAMRAAEETARQTTSAARPAVRVALDFYDTAPWFEELVDTRETATNRTP